MESEQTLITNIIIWLKDNSYWIQIAIGIVSIVVTIILAKVVYFISKVRIQEQERLENLLDIFDTIDSINTCIDQFDDIITATDRKDLSYSSRIKETNDILKKIPIRLDAVLSTVREIRYSNLVPSKSSHRAENSTNYKINVTSDFFDNEWLLQKINQAYRTITIISDNNNFLQDQTVLSALKKKKGILIEIYILSPDASPDILSKTSIVKLTSNTNNAQNISEVLVLNRKILLDYLEKHNLNNIKYLEYEELPLIRSVQIDENLYIGFQNYSTEDHGIRNLGLAINEKSDLGEHIITQFRYLKRHSQKKFNFGSASILRIENQDINICDKYYDPYYDTRCILLSSPKDIVILSDNLDEASMNYFKYIGFDLPINLYYPDRFNKDLAHSLNHIDNKPLLNKLISRIKKGNWLLDTFLFGDEFSYLKEKLNIPLYSNYKLFSSLNDKANFALFALKISLPTPEFIILPNETHKLNDFLDRKVKVVLKTSVGIGSYGVRMFEKDEFHQLPNYINNFSRKYILQDYIKPKHHYSSRIHFYDDRDPEIFVLQWDYDEEALVMEFAYYPIDNKEDERRIISFSEQLIPELQQEFGTLRGYIGLDIILDNTNKLYFIEMNPRKTASTYIIETAKNLLCNEFPYYKIIAYHFKYDGVDFSGLFLKELSENSPNLLFRINAEKEGIVFYNIGLLQFGIIEVISLSKIGLHREYITKLLEKIDEHINNHCT